jgi:hypothetical protein
MDYYTTQKSERIAKNKKQDDVDPPHDGKIVGNNIIPFRKIS